MNSQVEVDVAGAGEFGRDVGARLRDIRRQQGFSLQDVERGSDKEFKASVLGAYERGERSISVPRLARLAQFYGVGVDQLLPGDATVIPATGEIGDSDGVAIDLVALRAQTSPETVVLERYLSRIQLERQDFNGRILTVRKDDLRALGHLFDLTVDEFAQRLADLGLRTDAAT